MSAPNRPPITLARLSRPHPGLRLPDRRQPAPQRRHGRPRHRPARCCGPSPTPTSPPRRRTRPSATSSSSKPPTRFDSSHSVRPFFSRSSALLPTTDPANTAAPSAPRYLRRRHRPRRPATVRQPTRGRRSHHHRPRSRAPSQPLTRRLHPDRRIPPPVRSSRHPPAGHRSLRLSSLASLSLSAPSEANFGAATAFLLFPDWCAQCIRMGPQFTPLSSASVNTTSTSTLFSPRQPHLPRPHRACQKPRPISPKPPVSFPASAASAAPPDQSQSPPNPSRTPPRHPNPRRLQRHPHALRRHRLPFPHRHRPQGHHPFPASQLRKTSSSPAACRSGHQPRHRAVAGALHQIARIPTGLILLSSTFIICNEPEHLHGKRRQQSSSPRQRRQRPRDSLHRRRHDRRQLLPRHRRPRKRTSRATGRTRPSGTTSSPSSAPPRSSATTSRRVRSSSSKARSRPAPGTTRNPARRSTAPRSSSTNSPSSAAARGAVKAAARRLLQVQHRQLRPAHSGQPAGLRRPASPTTTSRSSSNPFDFKAPIPMQFHRKESALLRSRRIVQT